MPDPIFSGLLNAMFAPGAHIGVAEADYSMTQSEYKDGVAWTIVGGNRAGAGVNLPSGIKQASVWRADPANTLPVFVRCGGEPVQIDPGAAVTIITDKNGNITHAELAEGGASSAWKSVSADYAAASGERIDLRDLAGNVQIDLPASPADYDTVELSNQDGSLAGHTLTVNGNGYQVGSALLNSYTDNITSTSAYERLAVQFLDGKWSLF